MRARRWPAATHSSYVVPAPSPAARRPPGLAGAASSRRLGVAVRSARLARCSANPEPVMPRYLAGWPKPVKATDLRTGPGLRAAHHTAAGILRLRPRGWPAPGRMAPFATVRPLTNGLFIDHGLMSSVLVKGERLVTAGPRTG